jgi:hypothetical protein
MDIQFQGKTEREDDLLMSKPVALVSLLKDKKTPAPANTNILI